jgi:catechol 2,3-dioxygenase-like lactoylglutathione lyase family enzyme
MITGINHINLAVSDIQRAFDFYKDIMGFKPLCKSEGSAYFLAGNPDDHGCLWLSLDLDREQLRKPAMCNTHIAFSVSECDFDMYTKRILESGASIFKENTSPGKSLYFLDPDNHKLEIHVGDWKTRITYKKQSPGNWKNIEWFV